MSKEIKEMIELEERIERPSILQRNERNEKIERNKGFRGPPLLKEMNYDIPGLNEMNEMVCPMK